MPDARRFNVRDPEGRLLCPACGWPGYAGEPPYSERGGLPGLAICPCCLWEPGFDDDVHASAAARGTILESLRAYRARWAGLPPWEGRDSERPSGWDGEAQLARLFEAAPHLR